MKLVKKWLLPALTCLIVVGAAALPQRVSSARDARQFGQVHAETLEADSLLVRESPSLLERMELYARWCTHEVVPLYMVVEDDNDVIYRKLEETLVRLSETGLFPDSLLDGKLKTLIMSRIMLWDPESGMTRQDPVTFYELTVEVNGKSVRLELDGETGYPLRFSVYDLDLEAWMPSDDTAAPFELAERYFDLLGIDGELTDVASFLGGDAWEFWYSIPGTEMVCQFYRNGGLLTLYLDMAYNAQIIVEPSGDGQTLIDSSDVYDFIG